jgi:hypothetical protein
MCLSGFGRTERTAGKWKDCGDGPVMFYRGKGKWKRSAAHNAKGRTECEARRRRFAKYWDPLRTARAAHSIRESLNFFQ